VAVVVLYHRCCLVRLADRKDWQRISKGTSTFGPVLASWPRRFLWHLFRGRKSCYYFAKVVYGNPGSSQGSKTTVSVKT